MPRKPKDATKVPADVASSFFGEVETYLLSPDEPPSDDARRYVAGILRKLAMAKKDHAAEFQKAANINYRKRRVTDFDVFHKVSGIVAEGKARNISGAVEIAARELHIDERNARHSLNEVLTYHPESGKPRKRQIVFPEKLREKAAQPDSKKKRVTKGK